MSSTANHGRHGRPWRRIREQVLARDPYCQIRGPKCTGISTQVDHIVPLSVDPSRAHDLSVLRGSCGPCNAAGGAALTNAKRSGRYHPPAPSPTRSTPTPQQSTCRFHSDCGSIHSRPWGNECRGTDGEEVCVPGCAHGPSWCSRIPPDGWS